LRLNKVGFNGLGNPYYAAGVQSMLANWHNFFFLAFDPAGVLAMDKAPLALWIQAASAKVFGFHGLSLLAPQALAGILSVYVLYRLVRRAFGARAGLLAAFSLAVMPVSVIVSRTNFPDAWLILALLLAAGAVQRAVDRDSLGWLLVSAALVGLAFNIKMLQILLVAPALAAAYLLGRQMPRRRRLLQAVMALLVLLAVAAPWVLAVELTPPEQRPYVGGSNTNSLVELIFLYNGIDRLFAQDFGFFLGPPSPLRLFGPKLAGQIAWLLPLAVLGLPLAILGLREVLTPPLLVRRRTALVLWSVWLVVPWIYFSVSTFYHRYYLATMAPAVAALAGIAIDAVVTMWRNRDPRRWWGLVALLVCAALQALFLFPYPAWGWWLIPLVLGLSFGARVALYLLRLPEYASARRGASVAMAVAVLVRYITPVAWAAIPVATCTHMTLPIAGPQDAPCRPFEIRPFLDPALVDYLEEGRDGARFLAATYDLGIAELGILESGEPFMALGGYRGSDPILTVQEFAQLVAEGEVRFFLSLEEGGERYPVQDAITEWVEGHCPPAPVQSPGVQVRGPCMPGS
jgi:4-amino-4-deoxy-L-arabinose transferase-like glycosyltransferase